MTRLAFSSLLLLTVFTTACGALATPTPTPAPTPTETPLNAYLRLMDSAIQHYNADQYDTALRDADDALKLFPESRDAVGMRAAIFVQLLLVEDARAELEHFVSLTPDAEKIKFADEVIAELDNVIPPRATAQFVAEDVPLYPSAQPATFQDSASFAADLARVVRGAGFEAVDVKLFFAPDAGGAQNKNLTTNRFATFYARELRTRGWLGGPHQWIKDERSVVVLSLRDGEELSSTDRLLNALYRVPKPPTSPPVFVLILIHQ
jgi:tetratricopeptide (TPR) repeat protein